MANLLASLGIPVGALRAFEQVLEVSQNNVANASTPGWARQMLPLAAGRSDPDAGIAGGVRAGPVASARSQFAERNVRSRLADLGAASAAAELLAGVEAALPVSGEGGVPGALVRLFNSFSAWSLRPNDRNARQAVLDQARGVAQAFQDAAAELSGEARLAEEQLGRTTGAIHALAERLAAGNAEARRGARGDGGLDARTHAALDELAELVEITVLHQEDGSVTVLAGGSVPLVIGDRSYALSVAYGAPAEPAYAGAFASAQVLDAHGADVTARMTGGRLGGILAVRNAALGSLLGDSAQPGGLHRLARAVGERVNGILGAGWTADGAPPTADLFVWDSGSPAVAGSLAVNPDFTPEMLAAAEPGPPYRANGTALRLAALGQSSDPEDRIEGAGYLEFYAGLAAGAGRRMAEAARERQTRSELLAQARGLREQIAGVSLDEEAMLLVQYQRAYEAAARLVTVINDLSEVAVNLLR